MVEQVDVSARLDSAADRAEQAADILHEVANGGPAAEVQTNNGPLPSVAKWLADHEASFTAQAEAVLVPVTEQAEIAAASAEAASIEAVRAEAAAEAAVATGKVYGDVSGGLAATTNGQYFSVPSAESNEYLVLYRNSAGVAAEIKRYPSAQVVEELAERVPAGTQFRLSPSMTWIHRQLSPGGGLLAGIRKDGSFSFRKLNIPEDAIVSPDLGRTGQRLRNMLVPPELGKALSVSSSTAHVLKILGPNKERLLAVPWKGWPIETKVTLAVQAESVADGAVSVDGLDDDVRALIEKIRHPATLAYVEEVGVAPNRQAYLNNLQTGKRTLIPGADVRDTLCVNDAVIFDSAEGRKHVKVSAPSVPYDVVPSSRIVCFGDSLTASAGTNWPLAVLGSGLGTTAVNRGIAGQASSDIACRQGGLRPKLTVAGDTIPAAGAVAVTAVAPSTGWRTSEAFSFLGVLAGVPGTLAHDNANSWTFTRTALGASAPCPPGSEFVADEAALYESDIQVIWAGRNNVYADTFAADVLRDVAACIANLKPYVRRFVIVSVTNGQSEGIGTQNYDRITALNAELARLYGENYLDLRRYMVTDSLAAAGIPPTAEDLAALAGDRMPPSIMLDSIHFTSAGYTVIGQRIKAFIQSKGWF